MQCLEKILYFAPQIQQKVALFTTPPLPASLVKAERSIRVGFPKLYCVVHNDVGSGTIRLRASSGLTLVPLWWKW